MVYFTGVVFAAYFVLLCAALFGWHHAISRKRKQRSGFSSISVVVALRNEENNVLPLMHWLSSQDYPDYEVILVDDHSEDNTVKLIRDYIKTNPAIRVITNRGVGKKQAITTGISIAKGDIIAVTDADCTGTSAWLRCFNNYFVEQETKLVFGVVRISPSEKYFEKLQVLEFASVLGTGVSAHGWNKNLYCNGANLAYRKQAFLDVNGYEGNLNIASGDDEFLMGKFDALDPSSILFCPDEQHFVSTKASISAIVFIHQRLRWAGKWRYNSNRASQALAVSIALFQLLVLYTIGWTVIGAPTVVVALLVMKAFIEFVFLFSVCNYLKTKWSMLAFLFLQISYSVYVVGIGLFSNFVSYRWKGRRLFASVASTDEINIT